MAEIKKRHKIFRHKTQDFQNQDTSLKGSNMIKKIPHTGAHVRVRYQRADARLMPRVDY